MNDMPRDMEIMEIETGPDLARHAARLIDTVAQHARLTRSVPYAEGPDELRNILLLLELARVSEAADRLRYFLFRHDRGFAQIVVT